MLNKVQTEAVAHHWYGDEKWRWGRKRERGGARASQVLTEVLGRPSAFPNGSLEREKVQHTRLRDYGSLASRRSRPPPHVTTTRCAAASPRDDSKQTRRAKLLSEPSSLITGGAVRGFSYLRFATVVRGDHIHVAPSQSPIPALAGCETRYCITAFTFHNTKS